MMTYHSHSLGKSSLACLLSLSLVMGLVAGVFGVPFFVRKADAASLVLAKDTISDSDLSVAANHTFEFRIQTAITASSTIVIDFPDSFQSTSSPAFANSDATDYDIASSTTELTVRAAGGCTGSGANAEFEITSISSANVFTFTHCNGSAALAAQASTTIRIGTHTITDGTGNSQLVNPTVAGSQVITITAPSADSVDIRIAIIDDVVVTASVATTLTFTISGVASGQANANEPGGVTSITTTATTIPWGTLTAGGTASSTARQDLAVTTNARNGFTVTVYQDQNLLSSTGADIDIFKDGTDGSPAAWTAPAATLDSEATYGHEGITSEDSTLATGDTFGSALYDAIGTSASPLPVFYHTGPADGSTADKGATKIGFKIAISALQEAGTDYTQSLTYIATPTF